MTRSPVAAMLHCWPWLSARLRRELARRIWSLIASSAAQPSREPGTTGSQACSISPCPHELEGIVSKRLDRRYHSGRRKEWLKTKCGETDTFVVIGYQPSSRTALANLKVASYDGSALRYRGAVGTGFSQAVERLLLDRLGRLTTQRCPIPWLKVKGAVWVRPELRVEVAYRGWTTAGELRHASFKGTLEQDI
jgi:bifunctional non-homologous end joining protein LigD